MPSCDEIHVRLCRSCGYDLRGHEALDAQCPECGKSVSEAARTLSKTRRRVLKSFLISIAVLTTLNALLSLIDYQDARFSLRHVLKYALSIELGPFAGLALSKGVSAVAVLLGTLIVSTCAFAVRWASQTWLIMLAHLAIIMWFISGIVQLAIAIGESV